MRIGFLGQSYSSIPGALHNDDRRDLSALRRRVYVVPQDRNPKVQILEAGITAGVRVQGSRGLNRFGRSTGFRAHDTRSYQGASARPSSLLGHSADGDNNTDYGE